jgi:hypothetical protein
VRGSSTASSDCQRSGSVGHPDSKKSVPEKRKFNPHREMEFAGPAHTYVRRSTSKATSGLPGCWVTNIGLSSGTTDTSKA